MSNYETQETDKAHWRKKEQMGLALGRVARPHPKGDALKYRILTKNAKITWYSDVCEVLEKFMDIL